MSDVSEQASVVSEQANIHPVSRAFLFLDGQKTRRNFIWLPLVALIIWIILGVMHPLKKKLPYEEFVPGSWALYGFVALLVVILVKDVLFRLLARDEDYYGEGGLPDPFVSVEDLQLERDHD